MIGKKGYFLFVASFLWMTPCIQAVINIPTVSVGDSGNPNDSTGFGQVNYEYQIGTTEVTYNQYAAFLNDVAATDTHGLYNTFMSDVRYGGITRSGSSGSYTYTAINPDRPVNYVSFWDAARFTNWLTTGDTETGVYVLTPTGIANNTITRDATAWANGGVAIANRDEWYKAAYYSGSPTGADGDGYWQYPNQSNTITTAEANYNFAVGNFTDVGTYASSSSYYGTYDQGGNAWEFVDDIYSATDRGVLGGAWFSSIEALEAFEGLSTVATYEEFDVGFRIVSIIPEPAQAGWLFGIFVTLFALIARRR